MNRRMKEGLLLRVDGIGDLEHKLMLAAQNYFDKHGLRPTRCHLHPKMLQDAGISVYPRTMAGIEITPDPSILDGEFWIGRVE